MPGGRVTESPLETTVEVGAEFLVRRARGRRECADDHLGACRQERETLAAQVTESALDTMAEDGVPDGTADHEPDAWDTRVLDQEMDDEGVAPAAPPGARNTAQVAAASEAMLRREHGREGTR